MHEIKPIANHAGPIPQTPPQQPKNQDSFTSLLEGLLGLETGSGSCPSPGTAPNATPVAPESIGGHPLPSAAIQNGGIAKSTAPAKSAGTIVPEQNPEQHSDVQSVAADILEQIIRQISAEPVQGAAPNGCDNDSAAPEPKPQPQLLYPLPTMKSPGTVQQAGPAIEPLPTIRPGVGPVNSRPAAAAKNAAPPASISLTDGQDYQANGIGQLIAIPAQSTPMVQPRAEATVATVASATVVSLTSVPSAEGQVAERLNLADFAVTRFEYKSEIEAGVLPEMQSAQMFQIVQASTPVREVKPLKPMGSDFNSLNHAGSQSEYLDSPATIRSPEAVQHVRVVIEPPPPPPVVRSVSMNIGDPESQVRVVIRERNGYLNVQFGSGNERLRLDLQSSGSLLMRELQRNNPMPVTLDFSNFGSATDAGRQPRSQSQAKKPLKSDAEFAEVAETA